jgi:hypothetical protein
LKKSSLGKALSGALDEEELAIDHSEITSTSAVVVKKSSDFPPFRDNDSSFIVVMEELHKRIRKGQA